MTKNKVNLAAYARVSRTKTKDKHTKETTIENQVQQITEYTIHQGYTITEWFLDEIISGDAEERPEFNRFMNTLENFDGLICRDLDRFGRDAEEILRNEKTLSKADKRLILLELQGMTVDTSTPTGRLIFTIMAAMAEHEKARILARLAVGLERYKAEGGKIGRKPKKLPDGITKAQFKRLLEAKVPLVAIGRMFSSLDEAKWDWRTVKALAVRMEEAD